MNQIKEELSHSHFNYEFIAFSRVNSIYVRRDLLPALEG
jgi:hypothetical protein